MINVLRAHWSGRLAFILAATGSAVGLGNLWKFPYIAGANGGGAFVLIYLACIALVGLPILVAELYIGQQGQKNVVESFEVLDRKGSPWRVVGWMGLVSAVCILSFYSVVGGWVLDFEYRALLGTFATQDAASLTEIFGQLISSPGRQIFWHSVFMCLVFLIAVGGVKSGLERCNNILMPALLVMLAAGLVYSLQLSGFAKAFQFLFAPDTSQLTANGILEAVGHSFFTLSLGMGAILTYGSYLSKKENLVKTAVAVAFLDTLVALVAGLIIFSVVFSFDGVEAGGGPGLMFQTLPSLLAQLPAAHFISSVFFLLVTFAALTSAVSLFEVIVAYWEEKFEWARWKACALWAVLIYAFGLLSATSFNLLSDYRLAGLSPFDILDKLTSQYLLPIGGMLIALFFGFKIGRKALPTIFGKEKRGLFLLVLNRFVAPLAVALVVGNFIFQSLRPADEATSEADEVIVEEVLEVED